MQKVIYYFNKRKPFMNALQTNKKENRNERKSKRQKYRKSLLVAGLTSLLESFLNAESWMTVVVIYWQMVESAFNSTVCIHLYTFLEDKSWWFCLSFFVHSFISVYAFIFRFHMILAFYFHMFQRCTSIQHSTSR